MMFEKLVELTMVTYTRGDTELKVFDKYGVRVEEPEPFQDPEISEGEDPPRGRVMRPIVRRANGTFAYRDGRPLVPRG